MRASRRHLPDGIVQPAALTIPTYNLFAAKVKPMRPWLLIAALNGLIAVAAGAYGHHALATSDSGHREYFETGVTYQMWHALALLAVAWLVEKTGPVARTASVAGIFFSAGIICFSGSLYYLGLTEQPLVRFAAPLGGILLMAGWAALAWAALRRD
jgi:uncharacterized membrane protein YgdD (TMEM256/DUF423 family)